MTSVVAETLKLPFEYTLLHAYDAPVTIIENVGLRVSFEKCKEWIKTLPGDWPEKLSECMGQVTCDEHGLYLVDVEDTLYALTKGHKYRGMY